MNADDNAPGIPLATANLSERADGKTILIDRSKCFFPPACPGCGNCDPFVPMEAEGS